MIGKKPNPRQLRVDPPGTVRLLDTITREVMEAYPGATISDIEQEATYRYRRQLLRMCAEGRTMREVAALAGISQPRVSQIVGKAMQSLLAGEKPPSKAWKKGKSTMERADA